jgi:hypothetical protein
VQAAARAAHARELDGLAHSAFFRQ